MGILGPFPLPVLQAVELAFKTAAENDQRSARCVAISDSVRRLFVRGWKSCALGNARGVDGRTKGSGRDHKLGIAFLRCDLQRRQAQVKCRQRRHVSNIQCCRPHHAAAASLDLFLLEMIDQAHGVTGAWRRKDTHTHE
ncbi:hypothetical protein H310_08432 [Aphanomyces invadans]|uniref:Uncharacterized protein n=1 Tax=Aphanomyces invadans TaxID=157072 RepID=A0A024TZA5_9STRA|nr:hypothetical protein H310_08432 [Aphanomyces invadans]ETV98951.1 hypothetical protein H310_08432 [Aphanomyces invadans]|eukprot:XP_008872379.1 hypothetical protein H310_08432 [Aphanomyces invadans]